MASDDDTKRLQEATERLDNIIREAQRTKALVEHRLRAIREAGRPAPPERHQKTRKVR